MGKILLQPVDKDGIPEKVQSLRINTFTTSDKFEKPLMKHGGQIILELDNSDELLKVAQHLFHLTEVSLEEMMPKEGLKPVKRTKAHHWNEDWEDYRFKFIKDSFDKAKGNQDKLISILRDSGYVFLDTVTLLDRFPEFEKLIPKIKRQKYQWMLHSLKRTNNPEKDVHDPYILFGIQISPKRNRKTVVYLNKKFLYSIKMEIPRELVGVKKKPVQLVKYPEQMNYDERQKWGREHRQLMANPELKPSKFYTIYNQDVIVKGHLILIDLNNKHGKP